MDLIGTSEDERKILSMVEMLGNDAIFKFFTYIVIQEESICWDGGLI